MPTCLPARLQANTSETASESTPGSGAALSAEEQKAVLLSGTAMSGEATGVLSADGKALEMTIANSAVFDQESGPAAAHASRAAWVFTKTHGHRQAKL
ncbi:MAG: hypothetical protein IPM82_21815 [Saprospiraceae bacterium]|nr:hypothetical protein [Saprospiraceae bacterium]